MALLNYILFYLFSLLVTTEAWFNLGWGSWLKPACSSNTIEGSGNIVEIKSKNYEHVSYDDNMVDVKLYYESHCPHCVNFVKNKLSPVLQKLNQYINIRTYPYGKARTLEHDGHYYFKCQHGPAECYGNKLHACAIDYLQNITTAVLFNACMMDFTGDRGSNDAAADRCALSMSLDSSPIKACAKQERGTQLHKYYGDESKKAKISYVPYILINGKPNSGDNFMEDICAELAILPQPCLDLYSIF